MISYIFISLDKFSKEVQNITNELDAWLLFLSSDKPEDILFLIENYPWFKSMYETLFNMCQNIEGVMDMFSRELYEMDKNTELIMIDEFSKKVDELKKEVVELEGDIIAKKNIITEKDNIITEKESIIAEKDSMIVQLKAQLAAQMG